jgi:SAM-dependent methyltransferase
MTRSNHSDFGIDEIMQKIREEAARRKKILHKETDQGTIQTPSSLSSIEIYKPRSSFDNFLWKYGTRYAKTIKKFPILKTIAEKQHSRLTSRERLQTTSGASAPLNNESLDFLGVNWYYHHFFEQTKTEGLKGKIKLWILKYLGFFAWWQGQINKIIYQELTRQRAELTERDRKIEVMRSELTEINRLKDHKFEEVLRERDLLDGTIYFAFQNRFRGTRAEIKERMKIYLPTIQEAGAGSIEAPILDVGCGRGEWLELCQENHLVAKGVDNNRLMVTQCLELGFDLTEGDIIAVLENQEANSFGAITGFHIIEHLSLKNLISLFDESLRVLRPGGIVIFETPNPTNLYVSVYDFYRDPSHIRPMHPQTMNFLLEMRGFIKTGTYFTENEPLPRLIESTKWRLEKLDDYLNVSRDFALIGYKP